MTKMLEFDYELDYKNLDLRENPHLYRIGRGEQGVLLVRPYTEEICAHWRFKTPEIARKSAEKIFEMFLEYKRQNDFVGMDMARKFLEMGFTRARRYANHHSGRKYNEQTGEIKPQESDALTGEKAESARIFKEFRDRAANDEDYKRMRREWRENEKNFVR